MQKQSMNRRKWIPLVVLLLLFIIISYFATSHGLKEYPSYVSDSPSKSGVKAIYTYLEKEFDSVSRWSLNPELLSSGDKNHLMIMIEPFFIPDSKVMGEYQNFMKEGNTILIFRSDPKGMFGLSSKPIQEDSFSSDMMLHIKDKNGKEFFAAIHSPIRLETKKGDKVLLSDQYGAIAMERSYGKGKLLVSNAPGWMTNDAILKDDNLPLILSLLGEGMLDQNTKILVDEFTHGADNRAGPLTIYPKWFLVLLLQGILLTCIWLLMKGKRFGPVLVAREETVRFSDEGIRALAAWYMRGRRYKDSLNIQVDYLKSTMQEHWGISSHKNWREIAPELERKSVKMGPAQIQLFIEGLINILLKEKLSKKEYILWSKKIDQLRNEVEEG